MLFLFAFTLFVSAYLLFLVQPMIGKMILPLLGGTPQVWNTCMVFFQGALLAGYFYTHSVSTHLSIRRQLLLQGALLLVPFLFLPFALGAWAPPTESNPIFALLLLLVFLVGVPFFVVATSAPLLQKWFAYTGHPAARDPYFLYGASNFGSMLALIGYPTIFEPIFTLNGQTSFWTGAYALFIVLTVACGVMVWLSRPALQLVDGPAPAPPAPAPTPTAPETGIRPGRRSGRGRKVVQVPVEPSLKSLPPPAEVTPLRRLRWIGLAAVPSSLMLGVTTYLTTDIAAIPLFWVLPLALYLLTFILVFARWPVEWTGTPHTVMLVLQPFALLALAIVNLSDASVPQWLSFLVNLMAFFLTAMVCHGELARDRPSIRHLTEFYLWMSVGGVLGGLFNALIAPLIFSRLPDFMLVLALSCFLRPSGVPLSLLAVAAVTAVIAFPLGAVLGVILNAVFGSVVNVYVVGAGASLVGAGLVVAGLVPRIPWEQKPEETEMALLVAGAVVVTFLAAVVVNALIEAGSGYIVNVYLKGAILGVALTVAAAVAVARKFQSGHEGKLEDYLLDFGYAICLGLLTYALLRISVAPNVWGEGGAFWISVTRWFMAEDGWALSLNRARGWGLWVSALVVSGIPLLVCLGFSGRPLRFGLSALMLFLANGIFTIHQEAGGYDEQGRPQQTGTIHTHRSFFGVQRVRLDRDRGPHGEEVWLHTLIHGGIDHGRQIYSHKVEERHRPITYFHPTGGVGQIFTAFKANAEPAPYGVLGLGIGSLAYYAREGQTVHFYEIDPAVKHLSLPPDGGNPFFYYLHDARHTYKADVEVILGDGRLKLQEAKDGFYQILVMDAFSSDAIPIHLITREALDLYMTKLADGGLVVFNITNRYVNLEPVLGDLAHERGLLSLHYGDYPQNIWMKFSSDWVLIAKKREDPKAWSAEAMHQFGAAPALGGPGAVPWATIARARSMDVPPLLLKLHWGQGGWEPSRRLHDRVWTDDYTNLLRVVTW
ncbi:MAG: fused MFS/spermidine synthase [Gemmataceae bacterium]|nr:fused MFS/spermidine synthase [Gemmataceae bacterium]